VLVTVHFSEYSSILGTGCPSQGVHCMHSSSSYPSCMVHRVSVKFSAHGPYVLVTVHLSEHSSILGTGCQGIEYKYSFHPRSCCTHGSGISKYSSQYTFQLVPARMYIAGTALVHIQVVLLTVWAARTRWVSTGTALVNVQAVLITVYSSKYSPILFYKLYPPECTLHV